MPTCLLSSQSAASPELHGAQASAFPVGWNSETFLDVFLSGGSRPTVSAVAPRHLQESFRLLSQAAESKGQRRCTLEQICIQAGHLGMRWTHCSGDTEGSAVWGWQLGLCSQKAPIYRYRCQKAEQWLGWCTAMCQQHETGFLPKQS